MKSLTPLYCSYVDDMEVYTATEPPDQIAKRLRLAETEIVKLDANENPYGTADFVLEALRRGKYFHIYPDPAQSQLREKIAAYANVSAKHIIAGTGADELIDLVCRLVIEPGDKILGFVPTFGYYSHVIRLNRGIYETHLREADFSLSLEKVKKIDLTDVKLVLLCSPNNPSGNLLEEELLDYFLSQRVLVLVDEAYFEFSGQSFVQKIQKYENLVILRTFSKCFSLAGLRVGYGIMSEQLANGLMRIKPPYSANTAAEIALKTCLDNISYYRSQVNQIIETRDWLQNELAKEPILRVYPSESNFIFCRVIEREAKDVKKQLESKGILIRYFESDLMKNNLRISVGTKIQSELFLNKLRKILH